MPRHEMHGLSKTPEYGIWAAMKGRCLYASAIRYASYGGRGIVVCERWLRSFAAFYQDMGPRPSPEYSIDRKNNDGNYSCGSCEECRRNEWPANCRWATKIEQANNKRPRGHLSYNGTTQSVAAWARSIGVSAVHIRRRIKAGLPIAEVLAPPTPVDQRWHSASFVKMSQATVDALRADRKAGMSYRELMQRYQIKKSQIANIVTGKCWK